MFGEAVQLQHGTPEHAFDGMTADIAEFFGRKALRDSSFKLTVEQVVH